MDVTVVAKDVQDDMTRAVIPLALYRAREPADMQNPETQGKIQKSPRATPPKIGKNYRKVT